MLITPAIVALQILALCVISALVLASGVAWRIMRYWDINSGSALQIRLERQTYLISTLLGFAMGAELLSLLLFVQTAEHISSQFVGAMCATGVLNINRFGFPTLLLKLALCFLAVLWLALHWVDSKGYDYPLVRVKYGLLLLFIAPLALAEGMIQSAFFLGLNPEVITSCCGSMFSSESQGVAAQLAGWSVRPALILFYGTGLLLLLIGLGLRRSLQLAWLFAATSVLGFVIAIAAIISFISLYVYESPQHHCPFCLLKAGYDYVGYALYLPLFIAASAGLSAGVLAHFRAIPSLHMVIPDSVQRLRAIALLGFALFYAVATWLIWRSHLLLLHG